MPSWPAGTGQGHQWGQRQTLTEMSFHEAGKAAQDTEHSRQMLKGFHGSSRVREDGNYHRCTGAVGEPRTGTEEGVHLEGSLQFQEAAEHRVVPRGGSPHRPS